MSATPENEGRQRFGLTRQEVQAEFDALCPDGTLSEEFTDGELWPTAGLSDRQIELLTARLRKIRDRDTRSRLGRFGLNS